MTQDEIIEMAREAGVIHILDEHAHEYGSGTFENTPYPELEAFANLVAAKAEAKEREALAQPEQESVKMVAYNCFCGRTMKFESVHGVVAPQRTWVGLTRDEQSFVYSSLHDSTSRIDSFWVDFANAIEAKLKEKNSA
jgi:hypothetical protein